MATVVALVAVGLGLPATARGPAHADVPVNQRPTACSAPTAPHVVCGGVPITHRRRRSRRRSRVGGDTDRLVRGSAASAWGPLEQEAKAVTAELSDVSNDARLLVTSRDTMRSSMFLRLLDMNRPAVARGRPSAPRSRPRSAAFHDAALAQKRLAANDAIAEYDGGRTTSATAYQPPAGFGFAPYDTAGGCTRSARSSVGARRCRRSTSSRPYGATLAYQQYAGIADAQAAARISTTGWRSRTGW